MFTLPIRHTITAVLASITLTHADTMFTLTDVKKGYPVVEIQSMNIPQSYKPIIMNTLKESLEKLKINLKGYDERAIVILVRESYVGKTPLITMSLEIGEEVRRLDTQKQTFAMTYQSRQQFVYEGEDELEDQIEDALDILLDKFTDQYLEENQAIIKVDLKEKSFAIEMGYETNYHQALAKAKKEKKNLLFVLGANYCPWCRKFEQRVLLKKEVNQAIHQKYIPLILNREEGNFPEQYKNSMTPVVHFIDYQTGKSYHHVVGYNNREEFLHLLSQDK